MPKNFRFTLQPLLDRSKRLEEEKKQFCGERARERDELVAQLDVIAIALEGGAKRPAAPHAAISAIDLQFRDAHGSYLRRAIAGRGDYVTRANAALLEARVVLGAAARDRRIFEKLYERRRQAYDAELRWREDTDLDEANQRQAAELTS